MIIYQCFFNLHDCTFKLNVYCNWRFIAKYKRPMVSTKMLHIAWHSLKDCRCPFHLITLRWWWWGDLLTILVCNNSAINKRNDHSTSICKDKNKKFILNMKIQFAIFSVFLRQVSINQPVIHSVWFSIDYWHYISESSPQEKHS